MNLAELEHDWPCCDCMDCENIRRAEASHEFRALDVPCQCGVPECIYPASIAFECERCNRFVPACFGGCDPETGHADELCDECFSLLEGAGRE